MQRVLLVGAGKIGGTIASFLSRSGDYDVLVADADESSLRRVAESAEVATVKLSADDPAALHNAAARGDQNITCNRMSTSSKLSSPNCGCASRNRDQVWTYSAISLIASP